MEHEHPSFDSRTEPLLGPSGECLNCLDINFDAYFGLSPEHSAVPSIALADASRNIDFCRFCNLLIQTVRHLTHRNELTFRRDWPFSPGRSVQLAFFFEREFRTPTTVQGGGGVMKVRVHPPPWPVMKNNFCFKLCPTFMGPTEDLLHSARYVGDDQIDLAVCRTWLQECQQLHPKICEDYCRMATEYISAGFRVIDVVDMCVSKQLHTCRYIALSYVWGRVESLELTLSNLSELEVAGSLSRGDLSIPQTILDAVEVVKRMGERYLWVDRLCIIQDGPDKNIQMGCMDIVYGTAILTIVAAGGQDANAGLLGVRPGTRQLTQIRAEVWPDLELVVSLPTPEGIVDSVWASRGWTFQEQMLSRRVLIFRGGQVIWQCRSAAICEDTVMENKVDKVPTMKRISLPSTGDIHLEQNPTSIPMKPEPLQRPEMFSEYASTVTEYTRKNLTYTKDILLAYQGLSRILESRLHTKFILGLPEAYLDVALLWLPRTVLKRRICPDFTFPSWSWAGWIGQVGFEETEDSKLERMVPVIKWYLKVANPEPLPINKVGIGIDETSMNLNKSTNTCVWFPIFEVSAGRLGDIPQSALEQGTYLQFWTSCAFFQIIHKTENLRSTAQVEDSLAKPKKLLIKNARNSPVGYLVLNDTELVQSVANQHEFIVVSEAQVARFNPLTWELTYSEKPLMYNVLLVEWDEEHGVAYRVGLGRVFKSAWNDARPSVRFVTLG